MDSVYLINEYGAPISHALWLDVARLVDWVCDNWQQPDEGIWEMRGGRREFLYSACCAGSRSTAACAWR